MFEKGSGEGVTAARTAVLPPWAARAMVPPTAAAAACCNGDNEAVAWYASKAATGTRMKVCNAFQTRSKAGTLSAKNSTVKSARLAPMTHQLASRCKGEGSIKRFACASSPSVATVAYTFSPAAKLTATSSATSCSPGIFIPTV